MKCSHKFINYTDSCIFTFIILYVYFVLLRIKHSFINLQTNAFYFSLPFSNKKTNILEIGVVYMGLCMSYNDLVFHI